MSGEEQHTDRSDLGAAAQGDAALLDSVMEAMLAADPDVAVVIFDLDLRYRSIGGTPLSRHGYTTERTVGRTLEEVVPAQVYEDLETAYRAALRGETVVLECETVDRGAIFRSTIGPLRENGRIIGGIAVAIDVTARRREQALLRDSELLLERTFAASPIGMAIVAPDGRWLKVNPALCKLLGRDRDDLLDGAFLDVTHPDDIESDVLLARQTLSGARDGYELKKRYIDADGRTIWALLTVTLIRNDDGTPRWFVSQILDITARKQLQTELRRRTPLHHLEDD